MAGNQPDPEDTIDVAAAAERLGVSQAQIEIMVKDGMLTPVDDSGRRFQPAEVEALRLQGG